MLTRIGLFRRSFIWTCTSVPGRGALRTLPQVTDAVVVVRADLPGGPDLVAYVVVAYG